MQSYSSHFLLVFANRRGKQWEQITLYQTNGSYCSTCHQEPPLSTAFIKFYPEYVKGISVLGNLHKFLTTDKYTNIFPSTINLLFHAV